MTKKPVPPLSVTKFVVPSPNAALTFVTSTRTTLSALVVDRLEHERAGDPLAGERELEVVAVTRRNGPAGSVEATSAADGQRLARRRRPVVLSATPKVPLNSTGSPGILNRDGALDAAREPGRAEDEQRGAVLDHDAGVVALDRVVVAAGAEEEADAGGADADELRATVPAGACGLTGAVTCSKVKSPCSV